MTSGVGVRDADVSSVVSAVVSGRLLPHSVHQAPFYIWASDHVVVFAQDLAAMAESFGVKRKAGTAQAHGSGFGGTGFKFDKAEDDRHQNERKASSSNCNFDKDVCHQNGARGGLPHF